MSDFRSDARDLILDTAHRLAALRHVTLKEALESEMAAFAENLEASWGTSKEAYWRVFLEVVRAELKLPSVDHRPPTQRMLTQDEISHGVFHLRTYLASGESPLVRDKAEHERALRPWECECSRRSPVEELVS